MFLLKNSFSIPKLLYFLRSAPFLGKSLLERYTVLHNILEIISNIAINELGSAQAALSVYLSGLGITKATILAPSAFMASAISCIYLMEQILPCDMVPLIYTEKDDTFHAWQLLSTKDIFPLKPEHQKSWTEPVHKVVLDQLLQSSDDFPRRTVQAVQGR